MPSIFERLQRQESLSRAISVSIHRVYAYILAQLLEKRRISLEKALHRRFQEIDERAYVSSQLGFLAGTQEWEDGCHERTLNWDAPVRYGLWCEDKPIAGMSVEFSFFGVHIVQLQGIEGVSIPSTLSKWPLLFTNECISFAKKKDLSYVKLKRVHRTIQCEDPELRKRLTCRYDGTARKAKMKTYDTFSEWTLGS